MAQSRLEKIDSIFTRLTLLMKGGGVKTEDAPLWYEVYKAFPPKHDPKYDRPESNVPIRNILYKEDVIRAKYYTRVADKTFMNLWNLNSRSVTSAFFDCYNRVKLEGEENDTDEEIFEKALKEYNDRIEEFKLKSKREV